MTMTGGFEGRFLLLMLLGLLTAACAPAPIASVPPEERAAIEARLMRDISTLASDEFEGRKPGTDGETMTIDYIISEMQAAGLRSGTNDPGSAWRAPVELIGLRLDGGTVSFTRGRQTIELPETDAVVFTNRRRNLISDAEAVFVGYMGDEVPAEAVTGKVVVMLADAGQSPERRAALFEKSPAAILTVVDTPQTIARFASAIGRERIGLAGVEAQFSEGYVTEPAMVEALGREQWLSLRESADGEGFEPIVLEESVSIDATAFRREFTSYNVIGLIPGEVRGAGAVLLMAHWDHLGVCAPDGPDRICNGAVDNASGVAAILELSRRLKANGPHDRDIYVLATSAEELGLFGAQAFAEQPPVPLDGFVAAFNFDSVAIAPAGSPVGFIGEGLTPLDDIIRATVEDAGRQLGNRQYANSFLQRHDGWVLLESGVPAVLLSSAFASEITFGPYLATDYHSPSDEAEGLELGGAVDDLLLHEELIKRIASTADYTP
ncbi:MAG: M20/M25/M40 family metallo-hydrolase [Pseudomonadota bacterium]